MDQHSRCEILDKILYKNPYKEWTRIDLLKEINKELTLKKHEKISIRTFYNDIEYLRDKRDAVFIEKRGVYSYENKSFRAFSEKLTADDKKALKDVTVLMKQFKGLPLYPALEEAFIHIDRYVNFENEPDIVQFEANVYEGEQYITPFYNAVKKKQVLLLQYKDFRSSHTTLYTIHPYFLKEFRNRWYVVGWVEESGRYQNVPLDRIVSHSVSTIKEFKDYSTDEFSPATFFKDVIGVTVESTGVEVVRIKVAQRTAPYLKTKKLHPSQITISEAEDFSIFQLEVINNYELRAEIRRLGDAIEVLSPESLRMELAAEFENLINMYSKK